MTDVLATHRLVIVTGKGGVGKSLLASTLAALCADRGLNTILVTLDTRDDRHPVLDVPLEYTPYQVAPGFAVSRVDAFAAVAEYARRMLPLSMFYEGFFRSRAFRDFATAAPGFEDLMCLGKLYNLAVQSEFDRVIFDAPATGHLRELLEVPALTQRAVRVGPLNHNARKIQDLLLDAERTHVLVATLAEEMPVQEAMEIVDACRALRMSVGPVLVNRRLERPISHDEQRALAARRDAAPGVSEVAAAAIDAALDMASRRDAQDEALEPLRARRLPMLAIPWVADPGSTPAALMASVGGPLGALLGSAR